MAVPIGVPDGGVWGRVRVGGEGGFPVENEGNGEGGGEGGGSGAGAGKGTGKSMRTRLSKLTFSKLPSGP